MIPIVVVVDVCIGCTVCFIVIVDILRRLMIVSQLVLQAVLRVIDSSLLMSPLVFTSKARRYALVYYRPSGIFVFSTNVGLPSVSLRGILYPTPYRPAQSLPRCAVLVDSCCEHGYDSSSTVLSYTVLVHYRLQY